MVKMVNKKCQKDTGTCRDLKIELEVEVHRTKESMEHAKLRLKQVELKSKQEIDKLDPSYLHEGRINRYFTLGLVPVTVSE